VKADAAEVADVQIASGVFSGLDVAVMLQSIGQVNGRQGSKFRVG
jgi:hypothetical protein